MKKHVFAIGTLLTVLLFATGVEAQSTLQQRAAERRAERQGTVAVPAAASPLPSLSIPSPAEEQRRISVIDQAESAVVSVIIAKNLPVMERYFEEVQFPNGMTFRVPRTRQTGTASRQVGAGTAFFVTADGVLMTNRHVVSDDDAAYTVLMNDGTELSARVLALDDSNDIALLKVDRRNTPYLAFASGTPRLGQTAIAIGNALGEFRNTVSIGVVSGLQREVTASYGNFSSRTETISNLIQTDAAINQGNSGGPLLDSSGRVIGMNTATASEAQSIGFAIPADELRRVLAAR